MTMPLFVICPIGQLQQASWNGSVHSASTVNSIDHVVGVIDGFKIATERDAEAASKDLGLSVVPYVQIVPLSDGKLGVFVIFAVHVNFFDEAQKIPGFEKMFTYSGGYAMLPLL